MSDFFTALSERALGEGITVQPLVSPLYAQPTAAPLPDALTDNSVVSETPPQTGRAAPAVPEPLMPQQARRDYPLPPPLAPPTSPRDRAATQREIDSIAPALRMHAPPVFPEQPSHSDFEPRTQASAPEAVPERHEPGIAPRTETRQPLETIQPRAFFRERQALTPDDRQSERNQPDPPAPRSDRTPTPPPLSPKTYTPIVNARHQNATGAPSQSLPPLTPEPGAPQHITKVSIGRVEVRAILEQAPKAAPKPKPAATGVTLGQYLERRNSGGR